MMSFIAWIGVILLQIFTMVFSFGLGKEDAAGKDCPWVAKLAVFFSGAAIICAWGIGHAGF